MAFKEIISASHHVICEGPDDIALFCRIIRDRQIPDIQANCGRNGNGEDNRCLGTSGFTNRLQALKSLPFPLPQTRGLIIAADGDDDPAAKFQYACDQFAAHGLAVPPRPFEVTREEGRIKTAVMMIPDVDCEGGLESLLLLCCDALDDSARTCADAFYICCGTGRSIKDLHKLRLRALIAATCAADPSLGISHWLASRTRPFDLTHPALNKIAAFLAEFVGD